MTGSISTLLSLSSLSSIYASVYFITNPRIRRPISIAIGRYRATPIRTPMLACMTRPNTLLSRSVSYTRLLLSRYMNSSISSRGSSSLHLRRSIRSNGRSYVTYATIIVLTRGGRKRATLRPLSRIALTLSWSVTSMTSPSSRNMFRISCHES